MLYPIPCESTSRPSIMLNRSRCRCSKTLLKIKFTDFYDGFIWNGHCLYKYLNQYFELELSDTPDFIIYSCYKKLQMAESLYDMINNLPL